MSDEAGPSNYYHNYGTAPPLSAHSPNAPPPESPYSAAPSPAYIPGSALAYPSTPSLPPPPPSAFSFNTGSATFPFPQSSQGSKRLRGTPRSRNGGGATPRNRNPPTGASSFTRAGPSSSAGLRRTTRQSSLIEKFTTDGSRKVKLKLGGIKGKHRPGYMVDSPYGYYDRGLDDDKEEPLAFEEQFILRVNDEILKGDPEAGVKGLREAVMSRKPLEGVSFKFKDDRRAVFNHGKKSYSAKLVDLPCIIEGQKVLENKRLFKVADISQMLIVGEQIKSEEQIVKGKLHPEELAWPDGLTPPLKNVRKERWRKKIDLGSDATVVDAVERLIKMDQEAYASNYTLISAEELDLEQGVEGLPAQTPREDYLDPAGQTSVAPSRAGSHALEDRSRGHSYADGGSEDGGMREATVDAEQDIVNRFNERLQREADGEDGEEDEHDDLFGASEEEEEEEGVDEVSDVEEDEEIGVDKEDQELIKQQNKLAEEINDLEDAVKRKRVEVQGKQNRTLRERANIQLQKMIKELDSKRAEHEQVIQKRESRLNRQPSPTNEVTTDAATTADPAVANKPEEEDRNDQDDEDSLFGDSEHEDEEPVEEPEDEDADGEPDDGATIPTPKVETPAAEGMEVDDMDAVAEAVREQAAIAMASESHPEGEQGGVSSPDDEDQPIIPDMMAHAEQLQASSPTATSLLAPVMGRTVSQPSAAFDYEYSEPSASDSESDDD